MSELLKARVGRQLRGDGDDVVPWAGRQADIVTQPFGKYYQAALAGYIFGAMTPDGGVAPGTDLTSTTPPVSLYNPNGSGVNLVLLKARLAYVSGTLGAGEMVWVANTSLSAAATTGTDLTVVNHKLGQGAGVGKPFHTATIPAAGTITRVAFSLDASLASTAGVNLLQEDDVDGAIIIQPGATISLVADAAAGSTPRVAISLLWAEVPA